MDSYDPEADFLRATSAVDSARPVMKSVKAADGAAPPHGTAYVFNGAQDWWRLATSVARSYWEGVRLTADMITAGLKKSPKDWQRYLGDTTQYQQDLLNIWTAYAHAIFTPAAIEAWVHKDAKEHTMDDGTSPGGRFYIHTKDEMQKSLKKMPGPLGVFFKTMLKESPLWQDVLRGPAMAEQFRTIDTRILDAYRRLYPQRVTQLRMHGTLYDSQYNHKFLTETKPPKGRETGDIIAVDADKISALFAKSDASTGYPHIIVTSSHAQGETLKDVMSITHGIEALARDSEGHELDHGYANKQGGLNAVQPNQTLTIYACDVGRTPWKNGGKLLTRVQELKRIAESGERNSLPDTEFNEVSPGAKRIAKLILKCMAEEPDRIEVNAKDPVAKIVNGNPKKIRLRADAVNIAHHFQLIGYSKGGNVVSDAMRYLVYELTSKRADGSDVFEVHPNSRERDAGVSMTTHNVRSIVRSIACMALASVEVAMSEFDKEHGVRRVSINNQHDLISAHHNFEGTLHDERWIIRGNEEYQGHAPQHMMGTRKKSAPIKVADNLAKEFDERGYAHEDQRVARRLKEFFAPNYGKAAISAIAFGADAAQGKLHIEVATGTTDAQIEEKKRTIIAAFPPAVLGDVQLTNDVSRPGWFVLSCNGSFSKEPQNIRTLWALKNGFEKLKHDPNNRLVIAQTIIDAVTSQTPPLEAGQAPAPPVRTGGARAA